MIHVNETVIVEGKYDKIKLSSLIDAVIIETGGFSIFNDRERLALIRRMAERTGVLILTDSDAAGFKIRHFLGGALPQGSVKHAYIPDILGKEPRKAAPSKEGKLGVEGVPAQALMESLARAGVLCGEAPPARRVTKTDFYEDGLSGGEGSARRRARLLGLLGLPARLSSNGLLQVLGAMMTYDEYKRAVARLRAEEEERSGG